MGFRNILCTSAIYMHSPAALAFAKEGQKLFLGGVQAKQLYQTEKLKEIINYAVDNTEYYREIFRDKDLEINNAPVLTKDILRDSYLKMCSGQRRKGIYENTSGGSTGEPVKFIQDKEFYDKNFGNKILFGLLNGKCPGDSEVKLWGSERDLLEGSIGIKEKLINILYNRELLNSFVMSEKNMLQYLERINTKRPVYVWTYADSIYELSSYALKNHIKVFSPPVIVTTAGVLYDDMRETIQKCFPGSFVCNQYGSREAGAIGIEIKGKKGIRIFDHSVYIEILDENTGVIAREGTGRILVTSLINKAMPLIRFDIGDIGTLTQSAGDREGSFAVLSELKGRVNSHIKRKNGTMIHGEYFTHLFYGKSWIRNFQVIQHSDYNLEFLIESVDEEVGEYKNDISEMINNTKVVMPEAEVEIKFVDKISRMKSGKYQFVISEVL